ncbi:hypothetical protein TrCOL_g10570 [Triparma columacea]|uniref:ABC transporter domain-containing protein n=1 Tax=Triparma columacea TaxID=722753 RepID=A0A9W7GCA1_9STRA|nr:hypothetical protein TrCOL_g10570 [Triparma columacea]
MHLRVSELLYLVLFFLVHFTLGQGPNQDEWIHVGQVCYTDIGNLCGATALFSPQKARDCLEKAYNGEEVGELSEECREALSKIPENIDIDTLPGPPNNGPGKGGPPCFNDVVDLCEPEERANFEKMTICLQANYDALSDRCKTSIDNRGEKMKRSIPSHFLQSENKGATLAITATAIFVLAIPLIASAVAFTQSKRMCDEIYHPQVFRRLADGGTQFASEIGHDKLKLSFFNLSYFIGDKRILRNVSATFNPGTLTAIMGPSGSGKTTFLNVISGHATVGHFEGCRIVNGVMYQKKEYDEILRGNGYVEQDDTLLFENLTVWETLSFASLIRLPDTMTVKEKLGRALEVMKEVDLADRADAPVGGATFKGISGGQKRRLSIAIELLCNPGCLILDEPTSGLDSTTSLQLVSKLKRIAENHKRTVMCTIHQPRSEIFDLFDNVILLGKGGVTIYNGKREDAANFLKQHTSLDLDDYDNPADFVIDAVGLGGGEEVQKEERRRRSGSGGRIGGLVRKVKARVREKRHEMQGYDVVNGGEQESSFTIDDDDDDYTEGGEEGGGEVVLRGGRTTPNSKKFSTLAQHFSESKHAAGTLAEIRKQCLGMEEGDGRLVRAVSKPNNWSMVVKLFARRFQRLNTDPAKTFKSWLGLGVIGGIIAYAFSWKSNGGDDFNKPYQTFMILFSVSSVVFIMEYLILVPEYYDERRIFINERKRGVVANRSYVISTMLTEIPRAMLHSAILISVSYAFHDMNPNPTNILFCVVALMCGAVSWQSVICFFCCCFDNAKSAYDILFVVLGGATLFGGMLVKLPNIPTIFKPIYYVSVTAITQRALVVNDFLCCYLSASCSLQSYNETAAAIVPGMGGGGFGLMEGETCPQALEFVGDGSDEGNLGRLALQVIGLEDTDPFVELSTLFTIAVVFRGLAIVTLASVQKLKDALKEGDVGASRRMLDELVGSNGNEVGSGKEGNGRVFGDVEMVERV